MFHLFVGHVGMVVPLVPAGESNLFADTVSSPPSWAPISYLSCTSIMSAYFTNLCYLCGGSYLTKLYYLTFENLPYFHSILLVCTLHSIGMLLTVQAPIFSKPVALHRFIEGQSYFILELCSPTSGTILCILYDAPWISLFPESYHIYY